MSDKLWTDELIQARYQTAFEKRPDVHEFALLTWLRDDYEARIAALEAAQRTQATVNEYKEQANEMLRDRLSAANDRIDELEAVPSIPAAVQKAIRVCASYGMPLGITYAEYNAARDKTLAWLDATQ